MPDSMIKVFLAGGGGGCSLAVVGQPLDTMWVFRALSERTRNVVEQNTHTQNYAVKYVSKLVRAQRVY